MSDITKTSLTPEQVSEFHRELKEKELPLYKVGDIIITDRGDYYRVSRIGYRNMNRYNRDTEEHYTEQELTIWTNRRENGAWGEHESPHSLAELKSYKYDVILNKSIKEAEAEAIASLSQTEKAPNQKVSESTELSFGLNKSQLQSLKDDMEKNKMIIEARRRAIERILSIKRSELNEIVSHFQKQIKRVQRVIDTLELYLGVNEEVVQILEGTPADPSTPISLRQMMLYIDEEVGDPRDGGLDFQDIGKFDDWVTKDNNFIKLIPEEKGVVALKPRRDKKYYSDDWFTNTVNNLNNEYTYFLIRNGTNLYRVWADIVTPNRLFPRKAELQELLKQFEETRWERDKEEIDDKVYSYKRNVLVLQGLIERTQIFQPIDSKFNLLNPDTYKDTVQFIYDDEASLPSGRLSFSDWKNKINESIERGSRVLVINMDRDFSGRYVKKEEYEDRFKRYYRSSYTMPPLPQTNLYTVYSRTEIETKYVRDDKGCVIADPDSKSGYKEETKSTEHLYIKYNPKDETHSGWGDYWGHERKNNLSFLIYPDDWFVLNYDKISLDDIDFYINSRVDRRNYLKMMPLLYDIRKNRLQEIKWEAQFIDMVVNEVIKQPSVSATQDEIKAYALKCVEWWKNKVIWKRPINKDDTKALRMIKKRINKKFNL